MPAKPASAEEAEHVLACLHEVRLNPKLGNGQKFSAQDSCFAKRTGARPAQGCAFFVKVEAGEDGDSSQPDAQNRSSQTADVLESTREARLAAERQTEPSAASKVKRDALRGASEGRAEDPSAIAGARRRLRDAAATATRGELNSAGSATDRATTAPRREEDNVLLSMPDGPLRHNLQLYRDGHAKTVAAVEALRREADEAADASDDTVTSKTVLPPTGDKRTYYSLDTYAWPSNGNHTDLDTPWISRDGYPFAKRIEIAPDPIMLVKLIARVSALGQAYYFTGDERYARRAADKVRTFFLDERTGMYPSLAYAGMKPGVDKIGKPMGTINFRNIPVLLDGVRLIGASAEWGDADEAAWRAWLQDYKAYLETDHVRGERCSLCNHGLYYDLQMLSITRYLGRHQEARRYLERQVTERLRVQMRGGMLPNEMMRPTSLFYVNFVAEGLVRLAAQAELEGVDLWTQWSDRGDSVLDVWDWAASFWCDKGAAWILPQKADVRQGISGPGAAEWIGLPFTAATRGAAASHRGLVYARAFDAVRDDMKGGDDPGKMGALHLMRARLDSCLLNDCPASTDAPGPPPTWVGHCAALDGVARVQTTTYDFTIPDKPDKAQTGKDTSGSSSDDASGRIGNTGGMTGKPHRARAQIDEAPRERPRQQAILRAYADVPDNVRTYGKPPPQDGDVAAEQFSLFSEQSIGLPISSLSVLALCLTLACVLGLRFALTKKRRSPRAPGTA